MNNQYKVSVIVPVYNASHYLEDCIKSVLAQTYENLEVILVDDGSIDNSYEICERFSNLDQRVICFRNINHGVSYSRNFGIKNSTGFFIVFLDSDDYMLPDCVERLVLCYQNNEPDIVIGGLKLVYNSHTIDLKLPLITLRFCDSLNFFYKQIESNHGFDAPVGKLFIRSLIIEKNIFFNEKIAILEDQSFVSSYLAFCKQVSFIDSCSYCYIQRDENSLVKKYNPNYIEAVEYKVATDGWLISLLNHENIKAYYLKIYHLFKTFLSIVYLNKISGYKVILKSVMDNRIFNESIRKMDMKKMPIKEKFLVFLLRCHLLNASSYIFKLKYYKN